MGVLLPCAAVENLQGDLFHWGAGGFLLMRTFAEHRKSSLVSDVLSRVAARAVCFSRTSVRRQHEAAVLRGHAASTPVFLWVFHKAHSPTKDYAKHWCEGTQRSVRAACVALPVVVSARGEGVHLLQCET